MNKTEEYIIKVMEIAEEITKTQLNDINTASAIVSESLKKGGTIYTFGTGHSHILAEEVFYRAGGLVKVFPILDDSLMLHNNASRSSKIERLSGYTRILLESYNINRDDVIFVFSNSGRNTVSVDMAILAKEKGLKVICITNLKHSKSVQSRHISGLHLYEVCDVIIDNCGVIGDANIQIGDIMCGPTSTVIGAMIMQAIVCGAVENLVQQGHVPEVFASSNIDGGDIINEKYIEKYKNVIKIM